MMVDSAMLGDAGPDWETPMLPVPGLGTADACMPELVLAAILLAAV